MVRPLLSYGARLFVGPWLRAAFFLLFRSLPQCLVASLLPPHSPTAPPTPQKIQIKTLKGDVFKIDSEPADTVLDLKAKVEAVNSELAVDRIRLIHNGKVLKDTQTVQELDVVESSFIVCMVSKDTKVGSSEGSKMVFALMHSV